MEAKLEDLLAVVTTASAPRALEALFALLGRGNAGAAVLSTAAALPGVRERLTELLTMQPARAVAAYDAARGRARTVAAELSALVSAPDLLMGLETALASGSIGPQAVLELGRGIPERLGADSAARARALVLLARASRRRGDHAAASGLLDAALACPGVGPELTRLAAEELLALAEAGADRSAVLRALSAMARSGDAAATAEALAGLLGEWPDTAAGRTELAHTLRGVSAAGAGGWREIVAAAWSRALKALGRAQRERQGYFAAELREVQSVVDEMSTLLERGHDADLGPLSRASALAVGASSALEELLGELVAYQPVRGVPVSPRQVALEAVLSCKDQAASAGLGIRMATRPPAGEGDPSTGLAVLDAVLSRSALRQVLLRLSRLGGREGAGAATDGGVSPPREVTLDAAVCPVPDGPAPGAVFTLAGVPALAWERLRGALRRSTVPDILARTGGAMGLGQDGERSWLELRFPAPRGDGGGPGPTESSLPPHLLRDLPSEGASFELAGFILGGLGAARARELESWGEELACVLHDLRNSLTFVQDWLGEEDLFGRETIRQRCWDNIADVRFWLAEAGAMLTREPGAPRPYVDLEAALSRVVRGLVALAARKRVRLELEIEPGLPKVRAEPLAVAAVLGNLARNSLQAMPDGGGVLAVRAHHDRPARRVEVSLRDQGPGFPPEVLESGGDEPLEGLARPRLGLRSARRLMEQHGGELVLANVEGGGLAVARFPAGEEGLPRLAYMLASWDVLPEDARRALRAAEGLAREGNGAMARFLWLKALQVTAGPLAAAYRHHACLPLIPALTERQRSRLALAPALKQALRAAFGDELAPRVETAARSVLERVAANTLSPAELSPREIAALLFVFGGGTRPPGPCGAAATSLYRAAQAVEDAGDGPPEPALLEVMAQAIEELVALVAAGPSLGHGRPRQELAEGHEH